MHILLHFFEGSVRTTLGNTDVDFVCVDVRNSYKTVGNILVSYDVDLVYVDFTTFSSGPYEPLGDTLM